MVFCVYCVCLMSWVRKLQSTVRAIYPSSAAHYLEFAGFVVIHQPVAAYPKHRAWGVSVRTGSRLPEKDVGEDDWDAVLCNACRAERDRRGRGRVQKKRSALRSGT